MKKNKKTLIIAGVVIIVSGVIALFWTLWQDGVFASVLKKKTPRLPQNNTTPVPVPTDMFPLKLGSRGENVKKLQLRLCAVLEYFAFARPFIYNGKKTTKLKVDGIFGSMTQAAVEWWFMTKKSEVSEAEMNNIKAK